MNRFFGIAAAASLVAVASPAFAQEMSPAGEPTGVQDKGHAGFYGKVGVGAGYMTASPSEGDSSVSGMGTALGLAAGYGLNKNIVLLGEFNYEMALGPSATVDGKDVEVDDLSMNFLSVGPGAAYFLDNGINFGASLLYAQASMSAKGMEDNDAATGFGFRLNGGKEFALSEQFALNAGANIFWSTLSEGEGDAAVDSTAMSFGISVGGVFN